MLLRQLMLFLAVVGPRLPSHNDVNKIHASAACEFTVILLLLYALFLSVCNVVTRFGHVDTKKYIALRVAVLIVVNARP